MHDLYLSSLSNRMNEVMKVLTMIATIFIPLSFVVGLYGMNFDTTKSPWSMPELSAYYGYPVLLLLMLGAGVAMVIYFKRKGWF
jgi:magnesium transporter